MAEWLQVVHKVNRIRRNTFSEKFLMREERSMTRQEQSETEGRDESEMTSKCQRISKLCIFCVISFVSVVTLHAVCAEAATD